MRHALVVLPAVALIASAALAADGVGGLSWKPPATWKKQPDRPMRAATFHLPAAKGDGEEAELGIFYFGQGQGGAVDANVQRWVAQFEQPDGKPSDKVAKVTRETVRGLPVTRIDLTGAYLSSSGPMMAVKERKEGYRLLGAIVEGPEGAVFFKLTGPAKTVAAGRADFDKLVKSLAPVK